MSVNRWRIKGNKADSGEFTDEPITKNRLNDNVEVDSKSLNIQGIVACGYENVDWFASIPKDVLLQLLKNAGWIK